MPARGLSESDGAVHAGTFGRNWPFRPARADPEKPGARLAVPSAVADSILALRLRLAKLGTQVRMPSPIWRRRGVGALKSGLTGSLEAAQLRDLQRIIFALFDWNPRQFDKDATTVLEWCDENILALPRLPTLLLQLQRQYDQLCDLRVLEWTDLITRLSPELPEVVVRDWLSLLAAETMGEDAEAATWFSYLVAGAAVEAVALSIAVGDVEFLEAISQSLLYGPQPAHDRQAVHAAAVRKEAPGARDEKKREDGDHRISVIAAEEPEAPEGPGRRTDASSEDSVRQRQRFQAESEHHRGEGRGADVTGAFSTPTLTEQAQIKLSYALTADARIAAERSAFHLPEEKTSAGDSAPEAERELFGSEPAAPTKPVLRGSAVGDHASRLQRLAEQALKEWESRPEKNVEASGPREVGKSPEIIPLGEDETRSAASGGRRAAVIVLLACAVVLTGVGIAWWLYPGGGDFVEQHELNIERPPAPGAAAPEPPAVAEEDPEAEPAAVAPLPPRPAGETDSPDVAQPVTGESSWNIGEVFLLIACCFILLVDLSLSKRWRDEGRSERAFREEKKADGA